MSEKYEFRTVARIKVFGIGGAGCNAVNRMVTDGVKGVDFYICNTDVQSLNSSTCKNHAHNKKIPRLFSEAGSCTIKLYNCNRSAMLKHRYLCKGRLTVLSKSGNCNGLLLPEQLAGIWPPAACKSIYLTQTGYDADTSRGDAPHREI